MAVPKPPIKRDLLDRNFTPANRGLGDIKWIVVHDMEMPESSTTAENCNAYFNRPGVGASAHYCIDDDSIVQGVLTGDIAWTAKQTANRIGVHLEHAGYARQSAGQWRDEFSEAMLRRSAALTAWLCDQFGIPVKRLSAAEIRRGERGIIGHVDLTRAGIDGNNHTDPGPNFPWDWYLGLVKDAMAGNPLEDDMPTPEDLWDHPVPLGYGEDGKSRASASLSAARYHATEAHKDTTAIKAELAALSAAVQSLAENAGAAPGEIAGIVDKAVRDRLAKFKIVDEPNGGAA